jgi:hypothetical protein
LKIQKSTLPGIEPAPSESMVPSRMALALYHWTKDPFQGPLKLALSIQTDVILSAIILRLALAENKLTSIFLPEIQKTNIQQIFKLLKFVSKYFQGC